MDVFSRFLVPIILLLSVAGSGCDGKPNSDRKSTDVSAGTSLDDSVITTKVKTALFADPQVKSFDIKVETHKGTVQLSGFVDSQTSVDRAVDLARRVEGVKNVENHMTVRTGQSSLGNQIDDSVITSKIKSSFLADAEVKGLDILVVTDKGEVQLSGFADNSAQMQRAIDIASKVEGVNRVINKMSIKK